MYGAIIGDIAGSSLEFLQKKDYDFPSSPRGATIRTTRS